MRRFFLGIFYGAILVALLDGRILNTFHPVVLAILIVVCVFFGEIITDEDFVGW
ncbi:MAG: hypothetical protein HY228_02620 [Candidatus Yonathbacteria bacterium]|nr:hypothetical protein [Candidatus Yonathbacteria bacterium]